MAIGLTLVVTSALEFWINSGRPSADFSAGCEGDVELNVFVRNDEVSVIIEA